MDYRNRFEGIEGIVLDAVGTLIDPRPSVSEAYAQAALRQAVELDPAQVKRRFGEHFAADETAERRGPLATDEGMERLRWQRIVAICLPEVPDPAQAFAELWDHFGDPRSWFVFPDVVPAVRDLKAAGFRLCVGSNFDGRLHRVVGGLAELAGWAEPLVVSSEVGWRKPHPSFYLAACERLSLPPERVLCVGDDPENDVRGPDRAGLRSVLIDRGRRWKDVSSFDDLRILARAVTGKVAESLSGRR